MQLSPRRRKILRAFLEAMRPVNLPMDKGINTDSLVASFEDYFRYAAPQVKGSLPYLLDMIEFGTLPFLGTLRPFSKLTRREQDAYLQGWLESPLQIRRDLFKAVRAFFCLVYYGQPSVIEAIGYKHQEFAEEVRRQRYEKYGAEIAAHEDWLHHGSPEPIIKNETKKFEV
jgi:hypothetical protein